MVKQVNITLPAFERGFHLIDTYIINACGELPQTGIMHVFILHTSAGICINENADPTVLMDFETVFNKLVPEGMSYYKHDMEGDDDMPAHIKSLLSGSTVSIPIIDGRPALGTWQGIFLCEFRTNATRRKLIISIIE